MIGILLALCVAFLKSLWELAGKVFTDIKKESSLDEYSLVLWARVLSVILLFPLIFFIDYSPLEWSVLIALIFSSLINAVTNITAIKAVKYWDLSLVWPLSALTIPFLFFSSYLILGEKANIAGIVGVIVIFFGTYFLHIQELKTGWVFAPLKAIYHNLWARYMLITSILWSLSSPLDKIGVLHLWALTWMFYTNILISIFIGIYIFLFQKNISVKNIFHKKHIKKISAITFIGWLWVFLQILALKYTLVIYVIALKRASGIFSVVLWYFFFKEKNIIQKLLATIIMLAWVGIISILWNI